MLQVIKNLLRILFPEKEKVIYNGKCCGNCKLYRDKECWHPSVVWDSDQFNPVNQEYKKRLGVRPAEYGLPKLPTMKCSIVGGFISKEDKEE